jgi:hypothetical protein
MRRASAALLRSGAVAGLSFLVLSLAIGAAQGQKAATGKELVAVLDLDALGASKNQVAAVSERLREELLATGQYRIVDRAQMDKVLEEQALQQTGCTSQECAVQVGRILGVRKLITGKVNRVEAGLWLISCSMIDAESAEVVRAVSFQHQGDFGSLLAEGAPQLVGKLTDNPGAVSASTRAPARGAKLADAALQVVNVPPDARVFLNGAEKGKGPQQFTQLAPGPYSLLVRKTGLRPYKETVILTPGQTAKVEPKLEALKLAIFPIRRSGTWPQREPEEHTSGWVTGAVRTVAAQAGLDVSHTLHTDDQRTSTRYGVDLRSDPDVKKNAWSFFGNPDVEFTVLKGKHLDLDAVLFVSVTTGVTSSTGGWKAYLVDVKSGAQSTDSGTWPYSANAGSSIGDGVKPILTRFVGADR